MTGKFNARDRATRFWDKISTIERSCVSVLTITQSGRMGHILDNTFYSKFVKLDFHSIRYNVFDARFIALAERLGLSEENYRKLWASKMSGYSGNGPTSSERSDFYVTPHCEIGLLAYFVKNNIDAYDYIGVSHLSCYPCQLFLNALNHVYPSKYKMRGTHQRQAWVAGTD